MFDDEEEEKKPVSNVKEKYEMYSNYFVSKN
jgi:hypothetical protein